MSKAKQTTTPWNKGKKFPEYSGENHPNWKGGSRNKDGYIMLSLGGKRVYKHRLIMEEHLGRRLEEGECIDHINGIKDDNRIENLRVFKSNKDHLSTTMTGVKKPVGFGEKISKYLTGRPRLDLRGKPTWNKGKKFLGKPRRDNEIF